MSGKKTLVSGGVAIALAFGSLLLAPTASAEPLNGGGIHAVIPAVRHISETAGADPWRLTEETKIVAPAAMADDAEKLALDLAIKGNIKPEVAIDGTADAADIVLKVDANLDVPQKDGYTISASKDLLTITGKTADGAYWGEQTLVQSVASAGGMQAGSVRDWADVGERSFHQDMARKYYDKDYLLNLIHQMSYRKMNALQMHFSEHEGFRLESKQHPEIMSADYITQAQLKEIIAEGKKYHVEIIPALDMPGHMRQALTAHGDLSLNPSEALTSEGRQGLDFSKPKAVDFVKELVDEFAPLFPTTKWHLGSDEFVDFSKAPDRYPDTLKRIREKLGDQATFTDGFVTFINEMAAYLGTKGKTDVRVWNDAFYRSDVTQNVALNTNITIDYWTKWDRSMAKVQAFIDRGHKLINYNDAYMYWVLARPGGAYHDHPTAAKIYPNFHAGRFPSVSSFVAQAWPQEAPPTGDTTYPDWLRGASFAIWSDYAEALTQQQVADQSKDAYTATADRIWFAGDTRTLQEFQADQRAVGEPPVPPANLDSLVTKAEVTLTANPAAGAQVAAGDSIAYKAVIKNASEVAAPMKAAALAQGLTCKAGQLPVFLLDEQGNKVSRPGKNVALASNGAKATATSVEDTTSFTADRAIDGDATTPSSRWASNYHDGESITVTLKEPSDLVQLRLAWEGAYASKYTVEFTHQDGSTTRTSYDYTRPSNVDGKAAAWVEHPVNEKAVTAIKLIADKRASEWGASIFELEAYTAGGEVQLAPALITDDCQAVWSGELQPNQSAGFEWSATVAPDATEGATVLGATAAYALKPSDPASATATFTVKSAEPVVPDTEALQAAVDAAGKLPQADYTVDSWQAFAKALADAKRVLKDPQDQAQVDEALAVLQEAQKALQKKPVVPKPQVVVLVAPRAVDPGDCVTLAYVTVTPVAGVKYTVTDGAGNVVQPSVGDANRFVYQKSVLQAASVTVRAEVTDAAKYVFADGAQTEWSWSAKARDCQPQPVVPDTEALQSAVNVAGALRQADYTVDSWQAFAKALADAKRVLKDPKDQAQVNDALAVLQKAQQALQKKPAEPQPVVPDTEALQAAVDAAAALRQADYTVDSWQAFAKALADAKRVLKDPKDQAQVNDALAVLQEAQKALKKAEQPVTPTPDQPDSPTPDQPTPDQPVTPTPDNPKPVKPGKSDVKRTPDTGASLAWTVFASLGLLSVGGVLAARRRNA